MGRTRRSLLQTVWNPCGFPSFQASFLSAAQPCHLERGTILAWSGKHENPATTTMPAFEICGVVLGVIPLVISALEHYKAGKGAAAAFVKWRGHLDKLIFRLKTQQMLFRMDIKQLLREARVTQIDLTEEQCVDVLRDEQIGEEVQEYLGQSHNLFVEILSHYELCLKMIVAKIGHIKRLPDVSSALNAPLTRICYAFRFTLASDTYSWAWAGKKR